MAMDFQAIMTALDAALTAINGTGGYTYAVAEVNGKRVNGLTDTTPGPTVNFFLERAEEDDSSDRAQSIVKLFIGVEGWIDIPDAADGTRQEPRVPGGYLWADIRRALKADRSLGGRVMNLTFQTASIEGSERQAIASVPIMLEVADSV